MISSAVLLEGSQFHVFRGLGGGGAGSRAGRDLVQVESRGRGASGEKEDADILEGKPGLAGNLVGEAVPGAEADRAGPFPGPVLGAVRGERFHPVESAVF